MLDLKINHLQLLAQIVSTGSLTEAAQNLGLSAAAASRMLKKLQTEMNDPLFIWHERSDKSLVMQWVRSMFAQHAGEFDR